MQVEPTEKFTKKFNENLFSQVQIIKYRGLKEITLQNLKLVNIFVGPNGIGKSSLLEALYMLATGRLRERGNIRILHEDRLESTYSNVGQNVTNYQILHQFLHEFNLTNSVQILGECGNGHKTKFNLNYKEEIFDLKKTLRVINSALNTHKEEIEKDLKRTQHKQNSATNMKKSKLASKKEQRLFSYNEEIERQLYQINQILAIKHIDLKLTPCLLATCDNTRKSSIIFYKAAHDNYVTERPLMNKLKIDDVPFIKMNFSNLEGVVTKLYEIIKSKNKQEIIIGLQLFDPTIKNFEIIYQAGRKEPDIYVDLGDEFPQQFPIQLLGDGILRLFKILVEVVYAKGSIILIDEIECGFYYDTLERVFESLIRLIERNQCQLFITTHSREVIGAMHTAMENLKKKELSVYRLSMHEEKLHATHFGFESIENHFDYNITMR